MKNKFLSTLVLLHAFFIPLLGANALEKETSPYLLQHATNPVNWFAWNNAAFEKAKKEHKPIYLSIGYATCHWCHVMEKESFTNKKIAALLNKYFICIKVDREELPQVDALYQKIYKHYKQHSAGWPLNVFLTENRKVFYISGYIPPVKRSYAEGFTTLLPYLHKLYTHKQALHRAVNSIEHPLMQKATSSKRSYNAKEYALFLKKSYNSDYPGFGDAKQFPVASKIALMLDLAQLNNDTELYKDYFSLLDVMALHGLYDHIDGGFFRYSTDREWEIPHFEKMLYTQAELLPLYAKGYVLTQKELYRSVVQETVAMLDKKFRWKNFYFSASDADSDKKEGGYYIFSQQEVQEALEKNPHAKEIKDALGFALFGNIHGDVHLSFNTQKRPKGFHTFQRALQKVRQKRTFPFIDTKINTAWNAMMIEALYKAAIVNAKYAQKADEHLKALSQLMFRSHELYHQTIPQHLPKQKAFLEDYAFFIGALIASYENNFEMEKLSFAEYLFFRAKEKFYKNGIWYMSEKHLVKAPLNDKYYTSALAKMMQNAMKLAALKESFRYEKFARKNLLSLQKHLQTTDDFSPALVRAYLMQKHGVVAIKSNAKNLQKNASAIAKLDYPYIVKLAQNYSFYLVCTLRQCFFKSPTFTPLIQKIKSFTE